MKIQWRTPESLKTAITTLTRFVFSSYVQLSSPLISHRLPELVLLKGAKRLQGVTAVDPPERRRALDRVFSAYRRGRRCVECCRRACCLHRRHLDRRLIFLLLAAAQSSKKASFVRRCWHLHSSRVDVPEPSCHANLLETLHLLVGELFVPSCSLLEEARHIFADVEAGDAASEPTGVLRRFFPAAGGASRSHVGF